MTTEIFHYFTAILHHPPPKDYPVPHKPPSPHPLVDRLLQEQGWTQFQYYIMHGYEAKLVLAGRISTISISESHRLACTCSEVFGARKNGRWEKMSSHERPFLVPGRIERHQPELSDAGMIGIIANNVEDCSLTMFFREEDTGHDTHHDENSIWKLDLNAVATVATPEPDTETDLLDPSAIPPF